MKEQLEASFALLELVRKEIGKVVVGQTELIDRLLLATLCNGHVLIEGVPGVAKTLTVNTLAQTLSAQFSRIQFTPDLLPSDLVGTMIYNPETHAFTSEKGPVFANIVLADEINRAPAKVQSALLEAMQEKQVTLGKKTYQLPKPFLVLATQNPIEQEGTYPLPEAQVDRFMFKLKVGYPTFEEEHAILKRMAKSVLNLDVTPIIDLDLTQKMRNMLDDIHMEESIEHYILHLIAATRTPADYKLDLGSYLRFGASPRASIYLAKAARGMAFLNQRDYVIPDDVKKVAPDILRHRLALSYKADAAGITTDDLIAQILDSVQIP
jgi:MoxR-like ATPase